MPVQKITDSFRHAFHGIYLFIRSERNGKIHLAATILAVGLGTYFQLCAVDWLWILLAICLVWISEMANTAIEELCDKLSPEISPDIKKSERYQCWICTYCSHFCISSRHNNFCKVSVIENTQ